MPRIISGSHGGRTIPSPPTSRTRPTSDRVREAIFSRLDAWNVVRSARVLDLFAGTGALGFEAISRGAESVHAIEGHKATAAAVGTSARELGMNAKMRVDHRTIRPGLTLPGETFTLVFADPPYEWDSAELARVIVDLADAGNLADEATLVIERSSRSQPLDLPESFVAESERDFGDTRVEYYTYLDPSVSSAESENQGNSGATH